MSEGLTQSLLGAQKEIAVAIGRRDETRSALREVRKKLRKEEARLELVTMAAQMAQRAAKMTQEQLQIHISSLVTTALAAVFPDPYGFQVEFVERRGRVECDLSFVRNGVVHDPLTASGGGPLDVASVALRLAFWSLGDSRATLFLDEPFKFVNPDLHADCVTMLRTLAAQLGVQIVMISHLPGIIEAGDRVFEVHAGSVSVK